MNKYSKKQNNKLRQKIRFADSATIFLAYRRNIFMIQRPLLHNIFLFKFCKIDAEAVSLFHRRAHHRSYFEVLRTSSLTKNIRMKSVNNPQTITNFL